MKQHDPSPTLLFSPVAGRFLFPLMLFCLGCLLHSRPTAAQSLLQDTLREIVIKDKKAETGSRGQHIDSAVIQQYKHTSLQQLLQLHSNTFIKNYGVGSFSTISIRGSSAAQTAVWWQGLNINNAMSGISDFSMLPVSFFDEIKINYTGSSTQALGGNIELNSSKAIFQKQNEISAGAGYESLQNGAASIAVLHSTEKFRISVKGYHQQSKNRFTYYNPEQELYQQMQHANSQSQGLLTDLYVKIRAQQQFSVHGWAQQTAREIPPATFEKVSMKHDAHSSLRAIAHYMVSSGKISSKTSLGIMNDQLAYEDTLISFSTRARSLTLPFKEKLEVFLSSNQKISVTGSIVYARLLRSDPADLQRASMSLNYEAGLLRNKLLLHSFIQKEASNVFTLPWIVGLQLKQKLYRQHFFMASVSSNYRVPTLNELYFVPGGNKDLKPEVSRNVEGGIESTFKHSGHLFITNASFYTRDVKNWIVWYGGSILTPHNIQQVWSRGLEVDFKYHYILKPPADVAQPATHGIQRRVKSYAEKTTGESALSLQVLYAYTLSTTRSSAIAADYSIGKQIPYVPRYQVKLNAGYGHGAFDLHYIYAYTGYRFITTDESAFLLPYNTHNLQLGYNWSVSAKHRLLATFSINNLLNKSYESITGRVMPGRNVVVGLHYRLKY